VHIFLFWKIVVKNQSESLIERFQWSDLNIAYKMTLKKSWFAFSVIDSTLTEIISRLLIINCLRWNFIRERQFRGSWVRKQEDIDLENSDLSSFPLFYWYHLSVFHTQWSSWYRLRPQSGTKMHLGFRIGGEILDEYDRFEIFILLPNRHELYY